MRGQETGQRGGKQSRAEQSRGEERREKSRSRAEQGSCDDAPANQLGQGRDRRLPGRRQPVRPGPAGRLAA